MTETILCSSPRSGVLLITLNRPEKRNALSLEMLERLAATLEDAIRLMGRYQLGVVLDRAQVAAIVAFLGSLTGEPDATYIAMPELPASGPDTPAPDPS